MKILQNNDAFVVRLERGEELIQSIQSFAQETGVCGAFFHGLGGAEKATIGIYRIDTDKEYHFQDFAGPLELISINGNIALANGEVMVHCHATISGPDLVTYGGHVQSAVIAGTCELFIDTRTGSLNRTMDEAIGLKLLDIKNDQ